MLLAKVVIYGPIHCLGGSDIKTDHFILKRVKRLGLLRSIRKPVVEGNFIVNWIIGSDSHVIEGQIIEEERPSIVQLVLRIVRFISERTRPFAEVNRQSLANRRNIATVCLEDISIDLRTVLVGRIALQSSCCLTKLKIEASTESAAIRGICGKLEDDSSLVQAEAVAQHIICVQRIDTAYGMIEVIFVIAIHDSIQRRSRW